jgi:hypothetical protein
MTLAEQMRAIRGGGTVQFAPLIQLTAAQLATNQEIAVSLPLCGLLALPPNYVIAGVLQQNPTGIVLGIRINSASAPQLAWGLTGNLLAAFTGPVEEIYVQLLSGAPANVAMLAGRGFGLSYSGGMTAAGTPSTSPTFTATS